MSSYTRLWLRYLKISSGWKKELSHTSSQSLRAQAGELSANQVWLGMVRGMPHGKPGLGDRGLDRTHSWGAPIGVEPYFAWWPT
jgi:hypothetical protein